MLTAPEAAASMSAFLNERVANLSRAMGGDDADLRAALIVSSILGLTIARHFLQARRVRRPPTPTSPASPGRGSPPGSTPAVQINEGPAQVFDRGAASHVL